MTFLQPLISFIIVIGILVFVHELGHFLAALWTGMRADVFAIGMGPRLFGWNKIQGFTVGKLPDDLELGEHTDYRICAFPIGGYVKIIGMIDESFDTEFANAEPKPYEFRSKGALAKTLVLSAGVIMNFLLAIGIFASIALWTGHEEMATTRVSWIDATSPLSGSGLQAGDRVLAVDGKPMETWEDLVETLALDENTGERVLTVERTSGRQQIAVSGGKIVQAMASQSGLGIYPDNVSVTIPGVVAGAPAEAAGFKAGDIVLAVDTMPVRAGMQLVRYIRQHAGSSITMHIERDGQTRPISVRVRADSTIGIELPESNFLGTKKHETFSVPQAVSLATTQTWQTIAMIGTSIWHVVQGNVSVRQSFGGPVQIAKMASRSSDLGVEAFVRFIALISISLGVMNLLPVPGLDGGHLVFVGIEAILRRELPTSIKIRIQQIGMALLLMLMAFVLYLDLTR
ncbi:MAG: hypothetical protein RL594_829 [Bacteroidota bacterium]|jgi:regulator of sigma E protease